jgi:6-phosphogluconolactonase (cycloisomerase 2 family)
MQDLSTEPTDHLEDTMKSKIIGGALAAGAAVGLGGLAAPAAGAQDAPGAPAEGGFHAVFVQTDNPAGNQVVAYERAGDGALTPAGTYDTGGLGGVLNGSVVDHLASQGSLTYDPANETLYAVNAGSNTVSVFSVRGDTLSLEQVIGSGGTFPVSVAVRGDLVYVLNALGTGSVQGYISSFGRLSPLPSSNRNLGLTIPTGTTQFTSTPGQVAFSPDGSELVVTTKGSGNSIDVFHVAPYGYLSQAPVVNPEPGTVPFAVTFDGAGHLVVAEAGTNALATYALHPNGTVTLLDAVGTGASATCWVAPARGFLYASNAGSATVSAFASSTSGALTLLDATPTDPGTVDAAPTVDNQYLYVQTGGNGVVDGFRVDLDGRLAPVGTVTVPGAAGGEGIVAF